MERTPVAVVCMNWTSLRCFHRVVVVVGVEHSDDTRMCFIFSFLGVQRCKYYGNTSLAKSLSVFAGASKYQQSSYNIQLWPSKNPHSRNDQT